MTRSIGYGLFSAWFAAQTIAAQLTLASDIPVKLLTRHEAERIALANNPRIRVSRLLAEVQSQVVREVRSDELPIVAGNLTGVEANGASRISSGSLTAPRLIQHVGGGVQVSQLITDFGRTRNLVASERLREKARDADTEATRDDVVLATDQVFYQALEAQATLRVASQTVNERQTVLDQITALTQAKLKSELDRNFAAVALSQAKLLELASRSNLESALAALAAVLGTDRFVDYEVTPDPGDLPTLPPNADQSVAEALANRPDLRSLSLSGQAAQKFSAAQSRQVLPSINAVGAIGGTPVGPTEYFSDHWYGAAGINISIPVFSGFRLQAEAAEAQIQARAEGERLRDLRNRIARDARTAWLVADTERQRVRVTSELLDQANAALSLAQTRYNLGLSSIVELSQAQLQQTQAAIDNANARSQFGLAYASLRFQTGALQ